MGRWLLASLLAFLAALLAARYVAGPNWVIFLWLATGLASTSFALALAWLAARLWPQHAKGVMALLLALAATLGRHLLLIEVLSRDGPPQIEILPLTLATATVAWGALALLWGTSAMADHLESPPETRSGFLPPLMAALAVILSLYCLAPLFYLVGLRMTLWTVLGLALLVSGAYGVDRIHRRFTRD